MNIAAYIMFWAMGGLGNDSAAGVDDRSVADALAGRVRVLCWVMTCPKYHESKAKHVKATWARRCNKLLFMSTADDPSLPTIKLPVKESYCRLWGKTKAAFRYVYEHHRTEADWFLKADDDTYVVVENLRYMLSGYNSQDLIYFGFRSKISNIKAYMDGGAGYVLSRAALDKLVTVGLPSPRLCKAGDGGSEEDVEISFCLENVGVQPRDSRDWLKRGRFFPFTAQNHLQSREDNYYFNIVSYPTDKGVDCCSKHAVSFHKVDPPTMYLYDYFVYHLRPYGIMFAIGELPKLLSDPSNDMEGLEIEDNRKHDQEYAARARLLCKMSHLRIFCRVRNASQDLHQPSASGLGHWSDDHQMVLDDDRSVADALARRVRVLCWVLTCPKYHQSKAKHIKATWGKRCNKLLFMSTAKDPYLPAIKLPSAVGPHTAWAKTQAAFRHVYEHHRAEADWFLQIDHDTYVVVENLRYMVAKYNSQDLIYFGHQFLPHIPFGWGHGSALYLLSRAALGRLHDAPSPRRCRHIRHEDANDTMDLCLEQLGVKAMDARDLHRRGRFFPYMPDDYLAAKKEKAPWFRSLSIKYGDKGPRCCSDYAVSFHGVNPVDMYLYDYLIYHLRPYGLKFDSDIIH